MKFVEDEESECIKYKLIKAIKVHGQISFHLEILMQKQRFLQ